MVWCARCDPGAEELLGFVGQAQGWAAYGLAAAEEVLELLHGVDNQAIRHAGDLVVPGDNDDVISQGFTLPLAPAARIEELAGAVDRVFGFAELLLQVG